jgi:SAM-dependent methyltransferase
LNDSGEPKPPPEVLEHYASGEEERRLFEGTSRLERVRTLELLERFLPPAPAVVCDVGGGAGVYACPLARRGYEVHLVDPVPLHVEQARAASESQPDHPLTSVVEGDARKIDREDGSVDAVLLLGPLYHLTEREDRLRALRESFRVLRTGGVCLAAVISRFAPLLDGLVFGYAADPAFRAIVEGGLVDGVHRNPEDLPGYFTTANLHLPQELGEEVTEAGFHHETTLAIEGPGKVLQNFEDHWSDPERRARLLDAARRLEAEPSLLGVSPHLMGVAKKP